MVKRNRESQEKVNDEASVFVGCHKFAGVTAKRLKKLVRKCGFQVQSVQKNTDSLFGIVELASISDLQAMVTKFNSKSFRGGIIVADKMKLEEKPMENKRRIILAIRRQSVNPASYVVDTKEIHDVADDDYNDDNDDDIDVDDDDDGDDNDDDILYQSTDTNVDKVGSYNSRSLVELKTGTHSETLQADAALSTDDVDDDDDDDDSEPESENGGSSDSSDEGTSPCDSGEESSNNSEEDKNGDHRRESDHSDDKDDADDEDSKEESKATSNDDDEQEEDEDDEDESGDCADDEDTPPPAKKQKRC